MDPLRQMYMTEMLDMFAYLGYLGCITLVIDNNAE